MRRKMNKLIAVVIAVLLFGTLAAGAMEQNALLTTGQFAELLVKVIGIPLPAGTENLPDDEYYEVMANLLAEKGLNNFIDANLSNTLSCGAMADILYQIVGTTPNLPSQDKFDYLVDNGFIPAVDSESEVTVAFALEVLDNTEIAALVAEAYSPPEAGEDRARGAAGAGEPTGETVTTEPGIPTTTTSSAGTGTGGIVFTGPIQPSVPSPTTP